MNQFIKAMNKQNNTTTTLNGAKAFKSTKDNVLDLFAAWGGMRGKDITPLFAQAYAEDKDLACRVAFWGRDVREGAGERELFKQVLYYLAMNDWQQAFKLTHKVPELGRWDDLFAFFNTPNWTEAVNQVAKGIREKNGLCGKWMPRKGPIAVALTKALGLTPKQYRKKIVNLTKVVEQQMCAQQWNEINYEHVPSQASRIYTKAFYRHDTARYQEYKNKVTKGEAKVNANAIYPYEVLFSLEKDLQLAEAQWKALPDFVNENLQFIPVIDTSGSMGNWRYKGSPASIAFSLGLYLCERNKSIFKDHFITFSNKPTWQKVTGNLFTKIKTVEKANWSMNTDINAVFNLILDTAKRNNVEQKDMPQAVLIISDMQFDGCAKETNFTTIKNMYKESNYELPKLIFWNVNYHGNTPIKKDRENTALVSGYSPSIMKSILSGKEVTPYDQMIETIMNERYNF